MAAHADCQLHMSSPHVVPTNMYTAITSARPRRSRSTRDRGEFWYTSARRDGKENSVFTLINAHNQGLGNICNVQGEKRFSINFFQCDIIELTLARTGGLVQPPPPLRFFADNEKTAARSAAGFSATLWGKPCVIFGKKKLTESGQVTELWRHKRNNLRQL